MTDRRKHEENNDKKNKQCLTFGDEVKRTSFKMKNQPIKYAEAAKAHKKKK